MKKITALIVCMTLILSACQRTPEDAIVQGKDLNNMIDKAVGSGENLGSLTGNGLAADLVARLSIPERYTTNRDFSGERLSLTAEASINVPKYAIPLVRVEPVDFTQELIDKIAPILLGNTPMFEDITRLTKAEIREIIDDLKSEGGGRGIDVSNWIKELEAAYKTAPETITPVTGTTEIKNRNTIHNITGEKMGNYYGFQIRGDGKFFSLINNGGNMWGEDADTAFVGATLQFSNAKLIGYLDDEGSISDWKMGLGPQTMRADIETVTPDNFTEIAATADIFSYKQALDTANKFLSDAGITDMAVSTMTLQYTFPQELYTQEMAGQGKENTKKSDYCSLSGLIERFRNGEYTDQIEKVEIEVEFSRVVNGVLVASLDSFSTFEVSDDELLTDEGILFARKWLHESLTINFSSLGIVRLLWQSPYRVTEVLTDDSNLISFEKAKDIFETMYRIKYSGWLHDMIDGARNQGAETTIKHEGEVTEVRLSMRRITEQNNIERGLLVPVWDFYGSVRSYATVVATNETWLASSHPWTPGEPIMTINAIDGTIIDLAKGY